MSGCADSEEKHEPVSDIDTAAADSLKVLDPKRPIREADIAKRDQDVRFVPQADISPAYSITSSASPRTVGGISRLMDFAVFRFITNR